MNNIRNRESNRYPPWRNSIIKSILEDIFLDIINSFGDHKFNMSENLKEVKGI